MLARSQDKKKVYASPKTECIKERFPGSNYISRLEHLVQIGQPFFLLIKTLYTHNWRKNEALRLRGTQVASTRKKAKKGLYQHLDMGAEFARSKNWK